MGHSQVALRDSGSLKQSAGKGQPWAPPPRLDPPLPLWLPSKQGGCRGNSTGSCFTFPHGVGGGGHSEPQLVVTRPWQ